MSDQASEEMDHRSYQQSDTQSNQRTRKQGSRTYGVKDSSPGRYRGNQGSEDRRGKRRNTRQNEITSNENSEDEYGSNRQNFDVKAASLDYDESSKVLKIVDLFEDQQIAGKKKINKCDLQIIDAKL